MISTGMPTKRKIYWSLGVIFSLVFLFYRWSFTVAPEMRVLILDENGNVAPALLYRKSGSIKGWAPRTSRSIQS